MALVFIYFVSQWLGFICHFSFIFYIFFKCFREIGKWSKKTLIFNRKNFDYLFLDEFLFFYSGSLNATASLCHLLMALTSQTSNDLYKMFSCRMENPEHELPCTHGSIMKIIWNYFIEQSLQNMRALLIPLFNYLPQFFWCFISWQHSSMTKDTLFLKQNDLPVSSSSPYFMMFKILN